jgi:hypothetical protein
MTLFKNTPPRNNISAPNAPKKNKAYGGIEKENLDDIKNCLASIMPKKNKVRFDLRKNKTIFINNCVRCEWRKHCTNCNPKKCKPRSSTKGDCSNIIKKLF